AAIAPPPVLAAAPPVGFAPPPPVVAAAPPVAFAPPVVRPAFAAPAFAAPAPLPVPGDYKIFSVHLTKS
uniref:Arabinogalactan-like protein n=1 Tax=Acrobeloides nanus TaxID=290746 RepID=A0A914DMN4_9BILA